MSRSEFTIELASHDDDSQLRGILRSTSMPGRISVSFQREPNFFVGAMHQTHFVQVIVARQNRTRRIVGFGIREIRSLFVNGKPQPTGYLSGLRLLPEFRSLGLVARGYQKLRELHADGRTPFYLTTIASDNEHALRLLTSRRAGLPIYRDHGGFVTVILRGQRRPRRNTKVEVTACTEHDRADVTTFLHEHGSKRQFFPVYDQRQYPGMQAAEMLVARTQGQITGCLGLWDQTSFRQSVVAGYAPWLARLRCVVNVPAYLLRRPLLPAPGSLVRTLVAAHVVVRDDAPSVFQSLVEHARDRVRAASHGYLVIGLHEHDDLLPVARQFSSRCYLTRLYLVSWSDGENALDSLQPRTPYLETGFL